jgi:AAA15 family ATPase/GTPase
MLKSLKIENFRCFQDFDLQQLGRINLLVGTNNSGKTSILEAVQLLYARGDFDPIASMMERRGEYLLDDGKKQLEIAHLIHGHELKDGSVFSIAGVDENGAIYKCLFSKYKFITTKGDEQKQLAKVAFAPNFNENNAIDDRQILKIAEGAMKVKYENTFFYTSIGEEMHFNWKDDDIINSNITGFLEKDRVIHHDSLKSTENLVRHRLVTSSSLTPEETIELFDLTVLTPEEDLVYQALQTIEPKIKRIASVGSTHDKNAHRGGFFLQFSDSKQRVPIGSMGDGMWRVLGIALSLVDVKGGVLLIDEIDTGLHYSVMSDLWKLIWKTAKELDIQVFATTHNSDCWQSLAEVIESEAIEDDLITIHRIEKGKNQSVMFNQRQIAIAADRGIEVR